MDKVTEVFYKIAGVKPPVKPTQASTMPKPTTPKIGPSTLNTSTTPKPAGNAPALNSTPTATPPKPQSTITAQSIPYSQFQNTIPKFQAPTLLPGMSTSAPFNSQQTSGITEETWNTFTPDQQQSLIDWNKNLSKQQETANAEQQRQFNMRLYGTPEAPPQATQRYGGTTGYSMTTPGEYYDEYGNLVPQQSNSPNLSSVALGPMSTIPIVSETIGKLRPDIPALHYDPNVSGFQNFRNAVNFVAPGLEANRSAGAMGTADSATVAKDVGHAGRAMNTAGRTARNTERWGARAMRWAREGANVARKGGHVANNTQFGRLGGLLLSLPAYGLNAYDRAANSNGFWDGAVNALGGLATDIAYDQTIGSTPVGLAVDAGMLANDLTTATTGTSPASAALDYAQGYFDPNVQR